MRIASGKCWQSRKAKKRLEYSYSSRFFIRNLWNIFVIERGDKVLCQRRTDKATKMQSSWSVAFGGLVSLAHRRIFLNLEYHQLMICHIHYFGLDQIIKVMITGKNRISFMDLFKIIIKIILGIAIIIAFYDGNNLYYSKPFLFSGKNYFINNLMAVLIFIHLVFSFFLGKKLNTIMKYVKFLIIFFLSLNIFYWAYRLLGFFNLTDFVYCLFFSISTLHVFIETKKVSVNYMIKNLKIDNDLKQ